MGQSKGGGYVKKDTLLPSQKTLLEQYLQQAFPYQQQAAEGYAQFLPGGGGGKAITDAAMNRYQQQTIPSILNSFGAGAKSNSALNQALGASASDLNTNLASQLAQLQLQASQGLGGLGSNMGQIGLGTPGFAYMQRQMPFWQQALLSNLNAAGQMGSAYLGGMV